MPATLVAVSAAVLTIGAVWWLVAAAEFGAMRFVIGALVGVMAVVQLRELRSRWRERAGRAARARSGAVA